LAAATHAPVQQTFGGNASQNWATYVTGTATIATGRSVILGANGNIYVAGSTDEGTVKKAFVAEYDPTGSQILFTTFQAQDVISNPGQVLTYNHSEAHAIALDGNGNIYVTGQATNPTTRFQDAFVMRLSSSGKVDTTYGIGFEAEADLLGSLIPVGNSSGNGIVVAADGTATISGTARYAQNDIFVAQISPVGTVPNLPNSPSSLPQPYAFAFGPTGIQDSQGNQAYKETFGNGIATSPDGSITYVFGYGTTSSGDNNALLMQFNSTTPLTFDSNPLNPPTLNGTLAYLQALTTDSAGNTVPVTLIGVGNGIVVGADGAIYLAGTAKIQVNGQSSTYAYAAMTSADHGMYAFTYDDTTVSGTGVAVDPTGNIYLTGTAVDTLGNTRAFVDLVELQAGQQGQIADNLLIVDNGSGLEAGWGIAYSPDGSVYVTGDTSSGNLSTDGTMLNGQQDAFLANVGSFMT
jgi:hypothetical protein